VRARAELPVLDMLAWSTNRLWRARTTLWSRLALHSRDKAESDSRPNTHACHATSINKGQCCRTMLKMKNSSVSLSMLKVLRTWLAASQLTLNGAKESPWRCQCFLSYYNYYKIGYFCMGCRSSNWAPTCI